MFESRWNHLVWPYVTYGRSLNQLNEMNVTPRAANRIPACRSLRRGLGFVAPRQARPCCALRRVRYREEVRLLASKIEHPEGEKTVVVCRFHELRPHARDVRHGCGGRNDVVFEHALECIERYGQHPETRGVDQSDRSGEQLGLRVWSVFVRTFLSEYAIDLKVLQRERLATGREAQVGKGEVLLSRLL